MTLKMTLSISCFAGSDAFFVVFLENVFYCDGDSFVLQVYVCLDPHASGLGVSSWRFKLCSGTFTSPVALQRPPFCIIEVRIPHIVWKNCVHYCWFSTGRTAAVCRKNSETGHVRLYSTPQRGAQSHLITVSSLWSLPNHMLLLQSFSQCTHCEIVSVNHLSPTPLLLSLL